jgi:hypothetical protein
MNKNLFFQIHGVPVHVEGQPPALLAQILEELRFFACAKLPSPRIKVSLFQSRDLRPPASPVPLEKQDPGDELTWISEEIVSVLNIPKRTVSLYMARSCPEDAAVVIIFGIVGFLVNLELSIRGKVAAFHGAALFKDGKAILLLGKTNSGKTSLSYLMTEKGFSYLSEEDSFVEMTEAGTFRVLPYPRRIRITESVMKQHHKMDRLPYEKHLVQSLDERVFRIDPRLPFPEEAPLTKIILLDNDLQFPSVSVAPLEKTEALFDILASLERATIHDSPEAAREDLKTHNRSGFSLTKSIVDTLSVSRLKYNIIRDFPDLPGIITDHFETD